MARRSASESAKTVELRRDERGLALVGGGMAMYLPLKSVIFLGGFILLPLVIFLWYMRPKNEENSHGSPAQLR